MIVRYNLKHIRKIEKTKESERKRKKAKESEIKQLMKRWEYIIYYANENGLIPVAHKANSILKFNKTVHNVKWRRYGD